MIKNIQHGALHAFLYLVTLFVNKYVLSVLRFQFPTIYQGWQTFVAIILLRILTATSYMELDLSLISRYHVFVWAPNMLLYVISIYSGSVALSQLPIPCFLSLHSVIALRSLLTDLLLHKKCYAHQKYIAALIVWFSAAMVYWSDPVSRGTGYRWMAIHVLATAGGSLYGSYMKNKLDISEYHKMFLNYSLSVILLTPSTVLLGDAMAARHRFAFWYYYRFYASCIASGVFGVGLTMHTIKMKEESHQNSRADIMIAVSKLVTAMVSVLVFAFPLKANFVFWISTNMIAGVFLHLNCETRENATPTDNSEILSEKYSTHSDKQYRTVLVPGHIVDI